MGSHGLMAYCERDLRGGGGALYVKTTKVVTIFGIKNNSVFFSPCVCAGSFITVLSLSMFSNDMWF